MYGFAYMRYVAYHYFAGWPFAVLVSMGCLYGGIDLP